MKTPGQKQLISLQERVKVGAISVEEAVQEFKKWQQDQEKRSQSLRFQQENLKRLRESITRRHKEKVKEGKEIDLEITAPLQYSSFQGTMKMECAVYEPSPQVNINPPQLLQRGSWQTGSTSSTSSTWSNRQSTISYSSGTENDYEENFDYHAVPPCPPRSSEVPPFPPPPRIPPRIPERILDSSVQDQYTSGPSRALPPRPTLRSSSPPPIPRRNW
ncbi:phosphoinositide 3-kinase adapter protein 1 isoform X1 [Arapaima gigas]